MDNNLSNIRTGRITSSEIVALTSFSSEWRDMTNEELSEYKEKNPKGKATKVRDTTVPGAPFYSYVNDKIIERFFKSNDNTNADVFAFAWGKLCEKIVHDKLGFEYVFQSDVTLMHPEQPDWVGTPDGLKDGGGIEYIEIIHEHPGYKIIRTNTVTDIKCPTSKKGFFNLVAGLYDFYGVNVYLKKDIDGDEEIKAIRARSKEGEKYYWQLVSNACITGAEYAELIVFMPYFEDLDYIQEYNNSLDEPFYIVGRRLDDELPFIMKETGIQDLNIIRFKVPQEDKDFLTLRVGISSDYISKGVIISKGDLL